jgi:protein-S-isoprenylcysteine O-methyltransferase Ste14
MTQPATGDKNKPEWDKSDKDVSGKDRPNTIPWPPIILAAALLGGYALGQWLPRPWLPALAASFLQAIGAISIAAAMALYATAILAMRKARTNILPHRAADHLVTTGPFALSRNPIYLGNVALLAGLGLLFANVWYLAVAIAAGLAEHRFAVLREEAHLEHKFGRAWRDYKKRVRRWI